MPYARIYIFIGHGEVFKGLLNAVSKRVEKKNNDARRLAENVFDYCAFRFFSFFFLNIRDGQQALRRSDAR